MAYFTDKLSYKDAELVKINPKQSCKRIKELK
jgi:hypothetical protein